ncbi:MAG: nitronate monooxygenase [Dehalococcoidia bacterium]|nr:MAG: nitronate monooxygenase [Dehalococcoidia bacterium]
MANKLKTRVTEILGMEYPLVMGTMQGQSNAELVAAAANAGAFACIASTMFNTSQALREEIRKTKSLTDKPFGVNINLFPMIKPPDTDEYIDAIIEEGVTIIETAGRSPEELVDHIKKGNAILMHKVARLRDARTAERVGADIVEVVGSEAGGHPSREQIGGLVLIPQVVDAVKIPVIAGGGIADARGFVAILALGAEGVLIGTRFLATQECQIPPILKDRLIEAQSTDSIFTLRSLGDPLRALRNQLTTEIEEMEQKGATFEELLPLITGEKSREAMARGEADNTILACGQVVGMIHDIPTIKELIDSIINGAIAIQERLGSAVSGKG